MALGQQPSESGNEKVKKVDLEKVRKFHEMIEELKSRFIRNHDEKSLLILEDQLSKRFLYLEKKYSPRAHSYAMFHALGGGSTIAPWMNVNENDFPGDDSVEKFLNILTEKYK